MRIVEVDRKYIVYDDKGYIVIITTSKLIALAQMKD